MSSFTVLGVILGLAFMVETLAEFIFGDIFDKIPKLTPFKWCIKYIAVAFGVVGAFVYQFDLIYTLGNVLNAGVQQSAYGVAITGVSIGKGANYIHQLISTYFPKPV